MLLPCESRSLSYSQNRNLALNLCLPQTWTPEPPPAARPRQVQRWSQVQLLATLSPCWIGSRPDMMWLRGSYWVPYVLSCGTRASAALPSEQTPLLHRLRYHRIKLLQNCENILSSIQVKQVKGSSFHELWNHSESCLACLGFTVSLYHHQCPIIFLEHS